MLGRRYARSADRIGNGARDVDGAEWPRNGSGNLVEIHKIEHGYAGGNDCRGMTSCGCDSRAVAVTIDHRLSFCVTKPLPPLEFLTPTQPFLQSSLSARAPRRRGVSSLKQRLIEREAWVRRFRRAWSLRSPVRQNQAEISAVDDAVAVEVSAAGEAVAGGGRGYFHPRASGGDCGAASVVRRKSQFSPAVRPNAVESTEVVPFVPCVSPYLRTAVVERRAVRTGLVRRYSCAPCNPGGDRAGMPSWIGQGFGPQAKSTNPRSAPSTRPSRLMSAATGGADFSKAMFSSQQKNDPPPGTSA